MNANRAVIIDRWVNKDGKHTSRYGVGMRWRARFVDDQGKEQTKAFARSKALVRLRDLVVGRASLQLSGGHHSNGRARYPHWVYNSGRFHY